jgi:hypothetical protein
MSPTFITDISVYSWFPPGITVWLGSIEAPGLLVEEEPLGDCPGIEDIKVLPGVVVTD